MVHWFTAALLCNSKSTLNIEQNTLTACIHHKSFPTYLQYIDREAWEIQEDHLIHKDTSIKKATVTCTCFHLAENHDVDKRSSVVM